MRIETLALVGGLLVAGCATDSPNPSAYGDARAGANVPEVCQTAGGGMDQLRGSFFMKTDMDRCMEEMARQQENLQKSAQQPSVPSVPSARSSVGTAPARGATAAASSVASAPSPTAPRPEQLAKLAPDKPRPLAGAERSRYEWKPPDTYSVDWVTKHEGKTITMRRSVDHGKSRLDIDAEGQHMTLIERPDKGVIWMVVPEQEGMEKRYLERKVTRTAASTNPDMTKVVHLGAEVINGQLTDKFQVEYEGRTAYYWAEQKTHAPLRMQDNEYVLEWKNYDYGIQPASLYEPPPGYKRQVMPDLTDVMKMMALQSGMGMLKGAASAMAGQAGAAAGAAFGGPIGAMVGKWFGERAAEWALGKAEGAMMQGMIGME